MPDISVRIYGVRDNNSDEFKNMKEIYDVCAKNKVSIPETVLAYFNNVSPKESLEERLTNQIKLTTKEMKEIYEIDLSKLSKNFHSIRVVVNYD
jgi:hypothetical protein